MKVKLTHLIKLNRPFVEKKLRLYSVSAAGCHEYQGRIGSNGYGKFEILKATVSAHRVAYAFHFGIDPGRLLVRHKCDNPSCINPDHLELGTDADNAMDKVCRGRSRRLRGQRNGNSKLTEAEALAVLDAIRAGKTNTEIAAALPVTHSQISNIRLRKSWSHLHPMHAA